MLFIWHGSVLPQILPRLALLLLLSTAIVYLNGTFYEYKVPLSPASFTIFGIALALFLGFRNNVSYDRFWEGRKLWGALLNDTRSLARQALTLSSYDPVGKEVRSFVQMLIAFTFCLKHQLRKTDPVPEIRGKVAGELVGKIADAQFKPVMLILEMGRWVGKAREQELINPICQAAMDANLNKLSDIVGGCERIASTPIPYTYQVLLHRTVYLYCFLLPFGLVDSLGWLTPAITVFIAYTFVAFEAIADELEEPFGTEPNDLPLNTLSQMIEMTLLEMVGEALPQSPLPVPDKFILD